MKLTKDVLEEIIELDDKFTASYRLPIINQILKNQEDAEKIDQIYIKLGHHIQITERLKNRIYFHGMHGASDSTAPIQDAILSELQKILGEEE